MLLAVLAVAFVAAQTSQKSQIRLDKNQAIAKTEGEIDFTPASTQKPFWIVSLSRPGKLEGT